MPVSTVQTSLQMSEISKMVMELGHCGLFTVTCFVSSPDNPELNMELSYIRKLQIHEQFTKQYMDLVELSVEMTYPQYMELLQHYQNLRCTLFLRYIDRETLTALVDVPPVVMDYRMMFKLTPDLAKEMPIGAIKPTNQNVDTESHHAQRVTVELQLMDNVAYEIRKIQVNGILTNATVKDAIFYAASLMGIKKTSVVPPDNTTVYANLTIPPMLSLTNLIDFLQNQYGVYSKGCEYYYWKDRLYVYPAFETEPKTKSAVHIYNVPQGYYMGALSFHSEMDGDLHVVSNTPVINQGLTERTIENIGNSVMYLNAENMIDKFNRLKGEQHSFDTNNVGGYDLATRKGVTSTTQHTKYANVTSNPFLQTSRMAAGYGEQLSFGWIHAKPFLVQPGHRVVYHFDDDGKYSYQKGIVQGVSYVIQEVERPSFPIYSCVAQFFVFLGADKKR